MRVLAVFGLIGILFFWRVNPSFGASPQQRCWYGAVQAHLSCSEKRPSVGAFLWQPGDVDRDDPSDPRGGSGNSGGGNSGGTTDTGDKDHHGRDKDKHDKDGDRHGRDKDKHDKDGDRHGHDKDGKDRDGDRHGRDRDKGDKDR